MAGLPEMMMMMMKNSLSVNDKLISSTAVKESQREKRRRKREKRDSSVLGLGGGGRGTKDHKRVSDGVSVCHIQITGPSRNNSIANHTHTRSQVNPLLNEALSHFEDNVVSIEDYA